MDYYLRIQTYGEKGIEILLPCTYEVGIKQAYAFSEKYSKHWTRHSSCNSATHHMDYYADMYNEGIVELKKQAV